MLPEQMAPDDAEFWQRFDIAARGIAMGEGMSRSPSSEGQRSPATEGSDQKSRFVFHQELLHHLQPVRFEKAL